MIKKDNRTQIIFEQVPGSRFTGSLAPIRRWPVVCLLVTLLVMEVGQTGWTMPPETSSIPAAALIIPSSMGRVESFHRGTNGKTLFYIQDAHHSLEAQKNIARIIQRLVKKQQVKTVFEEGYEGPVPTQWFREAIPDAEKRKKAAWYLMDRLRLGGAEYAHILSWKRVEKVGSSKLEVRSGEMEKDDGFASVARGSSSEEVGLLTTLTDSQLLSRESAFSSNFQLRTSNSLFLPDFKLIGADDEKLHKQNIRLYSEVAAASAQTAKDLNALKSELNRMAVTRFPKLFKTWMDLNGRFHGGSLDPIQYLIRSEGLIKASGRDFPENLFPQIARLLTAERTQGTPALDAIALYQDIESLETWMTEHFLNSENRSLWNYLQKIRLLEELNKLTLSSPEFETLLRTLPALGQSAGALTREIGEFIVSQTKQPLVLSCAWEDNMALARAFYRTVEARDHVLAEKLKIFSERKEEARAVLVFGGFHKRAILQMLEDEGWSYAVIAPRIREISLRHENYYRELMMTGHSRGERIPSTEQWVTQQRLFNLVRNSQDLRRYLNTNLPRGLAPVMAGKQGRAGYPEAIQKISGDTKRSEVRGQNFNNVHRLDKFLMQKIAVMNPEELVKNIYRMATHPEIKTDHASFLLDVVNDESARVFIGYGPHGLLMLPSEYPVAVARVGILETRNELIVQTVRTIESWILKFLAWRGHSLKEIISWQRRSAFLRVQTSTDELGEEARRLFFRGHFKIIGDERVSSGKPSARLAIKPPYAYEEHYASLIKDGLITPLEFEQGLYGDLIQSIKFLIAGGFPAEAPFSLDEFSYLPIIQAFLRKYLKAAPDGQSFETTLGGFLEMIPGELTVIEPARSEMRSSQGEEDKAAGEAAQFLKQKKWKLPGDTLVYPAAGIDAHTVMAFVRARPEIKRVILIDPDYSHSGYGDAYRKDLLRGFMQNKADFEKAEIERISSGHFDLVSQTIRSEFFIHPPIWKVWENSRVIQLELVSKDYFKWNPRGEELPEGAALTVVKDSRDGALLSRRDRGGNAFFEKVFREAALFGVIYEGRSFLPAPRFKKDNHLELMQADSSGQRLWENAGQEEHPRMPADSYWLLRKNKFQSGQEFIASLAKLDYDGIERVHFTRYLQEVVHVLNAGKPSLFQRFHTYYWLTDAVFAGVLMFVDVVHALIELAIATAPLFMRSVRKGLARALEDRSFQLDVRDLHQHHGPAVKRRIIRWLLSRVIDEDVNLRQASMRALLAAGTDSPSLLEGLRLLREELEPLLDAQNLELLDRSEFETTERIREALYQDYAVRHDDRLFARSEVRSGKQQNQPGSENRFEAKVDKAYRLTFSVKVLKDWIMGRTKFYAEPLKDQAILRLHLDRGKWDASTEQTLQLEKDFKLRRRLQRTKAYPQVFSSSLIATGRIAFDADLRKAAPFITQGRVTLNRVDADIIDIQFQVMNRSEVRKPEREDERPFISRSTSQWLFLKGSEILILGAVSMTLFLGVSLLRLVMDSQEGAMQTLWSGVQVFSVFIAVGMPFVISALLLDYFLSLLETWHAWYLVRKADGKPIFSIALLSRSRQGAVESTPDSGLDLETYSPNSQVESLEFLPVLMKTDKDGWVTLSSGEKDSPEVRYKLESGVYLRVSAEGKEVPKPYELPPQGETSEPIVVGIGLQWQALTGLEENWVVKFEWNPEAREIKPVQIMAIHNPVKPSLSTKGVEAIHYFSLDSDSGEQSLLRLFRANQNFPEDFDDFTHWWKQRRFAQGPLSGLEKEILGPDFIQLEFQDGEQLHISAQNEAEVRLIWTFPKQHQRNSGALSLEWRREGFYRLELYDLRGKSDWQFNSRFVKKPGAPRLLNAIAFENGHLDFKFLASEKSLQALFPEVVKQVLVGNGLKLEDRVRFQGQLNRSEVRSAPSRIMPLLEEYRSEVSGKNLGQVAQIIGVTSGAMSQHVKNHPESLAEFKLVKGGRGRQSKIMELLEKKRTRIQGKTLYEAAKILKVARFTLVNFVEDNPRILTEYRLSAQTTRVKTTAFLLEENKRKIRNKNLQAVADIIDKKLSTVSRHFTNHPSDLIRYRITKGVALKPAGRPKKKTPKTGGARRSRSEVRGGLYDRDRGFGLMPNGKDWLEKNQLEAEYQAKQAQLKTMPEVLAEQGIRLEDYTTLVYPASGLREMRLLELMKKNLFPNLASFHLDDPTYHPDLAVHDGIAGRRVSSGEHVKKYLNAAFDFMQTSLPSIHIYDTYYEKTSFDFSKDFYKRVWIDKGPGQNAELRHDDEFYLSTLRRGIVRPGDLVLAVPFAGTDHAKYWHKQLAKDVYIPEYYDWRWDVFIVTEEDFTAVGLPVPARSELRQGASAAADAPVLHNLTGLYSVVIDLATFNALSADEQEEFYKLFEAYQGGDQVKFIFNAAMPEDRMRMPLALKVFDQRYSNVRVVSMPSDKLSFNDEGRRVISVSREGIKPVYSRFVESKKSERSLLKVRYGLGKNRGGLLAAALLLYETQEPENWKLAVGGFLTEIPELFSGAISDFLASYVAIGTSA